MERLTKKYEDNNYGYKMPDLNYSNQLLDAISREKERQAINKLGEIEDTIEVHLNKLEIFANNIQSEKDLIFAEGVFTALKYFIPKEDATRLEAIFSEKMENLEEC